MSLTGMQRVRVLAELGQIRKQLHSETSSMKKIRLLTQISSLRTDLGITITGNNNKTNSSGETQLIEKYRKGDFNNQDTVNFKLTLKAVYNAGLDVNEISSGMVSWFEFDMDRIAA